jgi:hypothetical protein
MFLEALNGEASDVRALLRSYVDEWLGTGMDGVAEEPLKRSLSKAPNAYRAVHSYVSAYRPTIMLNDNGYHAHFGIGHLYEADPAKHAANQASWLFVAMVDTPWRDRVYRCHRCKVYGVLPRLSADPYKRGVHCAKCRNKATAQASTDRKREELFEKRLALATEAWRRWTPKDGDRKAYVVAKVNKHMPSGEHISKNWVTWNLSDTGTRKSKL